MNSDHDSTTSGPDPTSGSPAPRHEPNTLSLKAVGLCVLVLLVLIIVSQPIVSWLLHTYGGDRKPPTPLASFDPGAARHWNNPEADLAALRKKENRHLNEYAWIDREHGLVRIPIAKAMELLAEQRGGQPASAPAPSPDDSTRGSQDEHEQQP